MSLASRRLHPCTRPRASPKQGRAGGHHTQHDAQRADSRSTPPPQRRAATAGGAQQLAHQADAAHAAAQEGLERPGLLRAPFGHSGSKLKRSEKALCRGAYPLAGYTNQCYDPVTNQRLKRGCRRGERWHCWRPWLRAAWRAQVRPGEKSGQGLARCLTPSRRATTSSTAFSRSACTRGGAGEWLPRSTCSPVRPAWPCRRPPLACARCLGALCIGALCIGALHWRDW